MSETTDPQTLAAEALLPHRFHGTKCSCREAEYNGDYAQRKEQHAAHLGAVLSGAGLLAEHRVSGLATWRELCEKAEDERDAARAELAEMRHWRDFYRAEAQRMNDAAQCYAGHECGHCDGCTGDVDD